VKLQLIVCPESVSSSRVCGGAIRRRVEANDWTLSGGVAFRDGAWIEASRFRITAELDQRDTGRATRPVGGRVTSGDLGGWTDRFILSVNLGSSDEWLEAP
jgi:hypothetical protein